MGIGIGWEVVVATRVSFLVGFVMLFLERVRMVWVLWICCGNGSVEGGEGRLVGSGAGSGTG